MKKGYEFVPGMKISFVVTSAGKEQDVEPYIEGEDFPYEPDWHYYAARVAQSLARVTEVFGWSEKELLSGMKQSSLAAFGGGGSRERKKTVKVEKKEGNLTLDDYF